MTMETIALGRPVGEKRCGCLRYAPAVRERAMLALLPVVARVLMHPRVLAALAWVERTPAAQWAIRKARQLWAVVPGPWWVKLPLVTFAVAEPLFFGEALIVVYAAAYRVARRLLAWRAQVAR